MNSRTISDKYHTLLINLLLEPNSCMDKNLLPKKDTYWTNLIYTAKKNRVISTLNHFLTCKTCSKYITVTAKKKLMIELEKTVIRYKNYKKVKRIIKNFTKNNSISLMLIKDIKEYNLAYYPKGFIPLKFDIDIIGKRGDLPLFKKYIRTQGYNVNIEPYLWLGKLLKYKFIPKAKNQFHTPIEFRLKTVFIPETWNFLIRSHDVKQLNQEFWKNTILTRGDFTKLPVEFSLVNLCLIYYFEDSCKGLYNLYRIWLLLDNSKDRIDWNIIHNLGEKYKIKFIISFVLALAENIFSKKSSINRDFNIILALKAIDLAFICRHKKREDNKNFLSWRDGYFHYSTRGFLSMKPYWFKLIFFLHPKRLALLIFIFIKWVYALSLKKKPHL